MLDLVLASLALLVLPAAVCVPPPVQENAIQLHAVLGTVFLPHTVPCVQAAAQFALRLVLESVILLRALVDIAIRLAAAVPVEVIVQLALLLVLENVMLLAASLELPLIPQIQSVAMLDKVLIAYRAQVASAQVALLAILSEAIVLAAMIQLAAAAAQASEPDSAQLAIPDTLSATDTA